jgi:hypothetical protein
VLLDERQPIASDDRVADHLARCAACHCLADRLAVIVAAVELGADASVPPVPEGFADRVVRAARVSPLVERATVVRTGDVDRWQRNRWTIALATAAALLLAAWPIERWRQAGGNAPGGSAAVQSVAAPAETVQPTFAVAKPWSAESLNHEQIWLATGRSLATLPVTFRRATNLAGSEGLGSTLLPVATSVTSTLESLLRVLPDEPRPASVPGGGTGRWSPEPPSAFA